jgi:3-oxoacyl-[acyl-carrier protein] reductase
MIEMTDQNWDAVMEVDLKAVFLCSQAVLPTMMTQRYGKIINISSVAGDGNFDPGMCVYASAKAGVISLTKVVAKEAGPYGINVNSIAPGSILTEMTYSGRTKEYVEKHIENRKKASVLGRMGTPQDIAKLALFLVSEDASFITGQLIRCDGGRIDKM